MDTRDEKTGGDTPPQVPRKHPDEWQRELNPDHLAGQNVGEWTAEQETTLPTAYDVKEAHRALAERFPDDDLRQIPILPPGQRLQQGATYVDLHDRERREFTALGGMAAGEANWYVPKDRVPYPIWNRLIGVENPERLDRAPDRDREG